MDGDEESLEDKFSELYFDIIAMFIYAIKKGN